MAYRFDTQVRVQDQGFDIQRTTGGVGGTHTVTLTNGHYHVYLTGYPSGSDLLDELVTQVRAAHADFGNFDVTVDSEGFVQFEMGAGEAATITWTGGGAEGTELRDILRASGSTTSFSPTEKMDRTYLGGWYPQWFPTLVTDLPEYEERGTQSVSDQGNAQNTSHGERKRWRLEPRCKGFPYSSPAGNEWHAMRDFFRQAARYKFRYYRDTTETGAYSDSNPDGYVDLILDKGSRGWTPPPANGNFYRFWQKQLTAWQQ